MTPLMQWNWLSIATTNRTMGNLVWKHLHMCYFYVRKNGKVSSKRTNLQITSLLIWPYTMLLFPINLQPISMCLPTWLAWLMHVSTKSRKPRKKQETVGTKQLGKQQIRIGIKWYLSRYWYSTIALPIRIWSASSTIYNRDT